MLRRCLATSAGLLLLLLFVWCHQQQYGSATPASRLALLNAVIERRSLELRREAQDTPDVIRIEGRYYSDKAPGTVALALPAVWVASQWAGAEVGAPNGESVLLLRSWAAAGFSQGVSAAVGAALLLAWLRGFVSARTGLVSVLALWLGSLPLPYATLLFSHAQVIGLISVGMWALYVFQPSLELREKRSTWRMTLAGLCLGLALASEYTSGLVVVSLVLYAVIWFRHGRLVFLLAAIPPLLLIPAYSWATIGTPFDLPYSYQTNFPAMQEGLYAIKWPDVENLGRLLIGPTRGLVFWTPFLLMAVPGWCWMAKHRPKWLWLTYALPLLHIVVISGGHGTGKRALRSALATWRLSCRCWRSRAPLDFSSGRNSVERWQRCRWS